jgi:hypothetical protein
MDSSPVWEDYLFSSRLIIFLANAIALRLEFNLSLQFGELLFMRQIILIALIGFSLGQPTIA